MKMPRTIKIIRLMNRVVSRFLNNQPFGLEDSLGQLDELGGIYIKFLQLAVLSSGSVGSRNFVELLKVYEDSKPDQISIVDYLKEINMPMRENIYEISTVPLATGSFGQVYKARLADGNEVIIKVLRPSVKKYLNFDLRLLRIICTAFSLFDKQKMVNLNQIYSQFKESCLNEVNYEREAEIADIYYRTYISHPNLVIPKSYRNMSNSNVLVQEYIEGLSLAKLLAYQKESSKAREYVAENYGSDLFKQLEVVGSELITKALKGEVFHSDPHPGNIILLKNNRVALIDFGMNTIMQSNRLAFYELLKQYKNFYEGNYTIDDIGVAALRYLSPKLFTAINDADKIFALEGVSNRKTLTERLREVTKMVASEADTKSVIDGMLQQNLIMKALFFALNRGNRFGFVFEIDSANTLKATQGYLTLLGQFDSGTEVVRAVMNNVVDYYQDNIDKLIDNNIEQSEPYESIELLSCWFDKMSRNDPWLTSALIGGL